MDVSVLIPTYARTAWLQEALYCVLRQKTQARFEVVILNDCPRQTLVTSEKHVRIINTATTYETLGLKRNALLDAARGRWVMWQDDDDLCMPWHVERMLKGVKGASAAASMSCWSRYGDDWVVGYQTLEVIADTDVARHCRFPVDRDVGEDREFRSRLIERGLIELPGTDMSYVYRWANGTHHVSGSGDPLGGVGFRQHAAGLLDSGEEPSGVVDIVPVLRRDYFANAPKSVRMRLNGDFSLDAP